MSFYFLLMTCMVVSALATFPSFVKICGRKNSHFDSCFINSGESLAPHLKEGIPALHLPSLDPCEIDDLQISNTTDLTAFASGVKIFGLSDYKIRSMHFDFQELVATCEMYFPRMNLQAHYTVNVKLGSITIAGKGPMTLDADGIKFDVTMKMKKTERKGVIYGVIRNVELKLDFENYDARFGPSDEVDSVLAEGLNTIFQSNKDGIKAQLLPNMETSIAKQVGKVGNGLFGSLPFDTLFPDHE